MARSRIIKPEFWSDEKLASLSRDIRLTFVGLWSTSDDFGVTKAHPAWLKAQIFPYDDIPVTKFKGWLDSLRKLGRIIPFQSNGEQYYFIPGFVRHQKVDHPSQINRNPAPPQDILTLASDSRDSREDTRQTPLQTETETETETEVKQRGIRERFESFWKAYPKKKSKGDAENVWSRIKPSEQLLAIMIAKIETAKTSAEWTKENGQFIPYPATWLNRKGWEDEYTCPVPITPNRPLTPAEKALSERGLL